MTSRDHSEARIREAAARWVARRHAGEYTDDDRAFDAWLAGNPACRACYDEAERLWQSLGGLETAGFRQLEEARANGRRTQRRREMIRLGGHGFAAALLAAALFASPWWPQERNEIIRTAIGERRTLWLGDGSTIEVNTNSELTLHVSWLQRSARLIRGEALFAIAHSALKPFEVEAAGGRIRDLGTMFDVRLEGERASVYVLEGEVSIVTANGERAASLKPGYARSFGRNGEIAALEALDAEAVAAWANGELVLNARPLSQVLAELGRYHTATVKLEAPELAAMTLSGVMPTYDLDAALETIAAVLPLKLVRPSPGLYILESGRKGTPEK
jgi:transmembrane sensor